MLQSTVAATHQMGGSGQGYNPILLGQRLKALAFTLFKPIAFASFAALKRAFVLLATLKRVFVFLDA